MMPRLDTLFSLLVENSGGLLLASAAFFAGLLAGVLITAALWKRRLSLETAVSTEERQRLQRELQHTQEALLHETERRAACSQLAQRVPELERELAEARVSSDRLQQELAQLQADHAALETLRTKERENAEERLAALKEAGDTMRNAFQAMASNALQANNQAFLQLAQNTLARYHQKAENDLESRRQAVAELVRPLQEALSRYEEELKGIEKERQHAYARLSQQVQSLSAAQGQLIGETANLVKALRRPQVRGRWGEMTLRRVVELAGLSTHCDFTEQPVTDTGSDRLRPDMIVSLPGNRVVVIDAKAPLQAYLDALEASTDADRDGHLAAHARQIRSHMQQLASKHYWSQFEQTPEFVVLFLPGESFFSAALEKDPRLIETGVHQRVILATPTTLIALLRAIAYGWQQQAMTENARAVSRLGKELHDRIVLLASHFQDLGRSLGRSVQHYNRLLGAMESRVLVSARKFKELGVSAKGDIAQPEPLEGIVRHVNFPEATEGEAEESEP
jgi:DNA recombination protein RmuC